MNLTVILSVVTALIGLPALWALLIDVLKWAGVVKDDTAGKWSAAFNLITLIVVAIVVNFYPSVSLPGIDAKLVEIAKFASLIFGYVVQIFGTKGMHLFYTRTLKIRAFTNSK